MSTTFAVSRLRAFSNTVFQAAGLSPFDAAEVTECLIHADLRGHASHGLTRIPIYAERIKAGVVNAVPEVKITYPAPAFLVADADNGPGPVVTNTVLQAAITTARQQGACVAVIGHSNHNGSGSYYVEKAVAAGCIAIAATNAPPSMAVFGGREPVIGTNPISFGAPVADDGTLLMDMATSVVARGKIVEGAKRGDTIPAGWALDKSGKPTTDARAAEQGVVLPMSGPKGSALAIMIELLCGVLSGGRFGQQMGNLYSDWELTQDVGHFFLLIDAQKSPLGGGFSNRVKDLIADLKASAVAEGFDSILMPGEPERHKSETAEGAGITLPPNVLEDLQNTADKLGIPGLAAPVSVT